MLTNRAVSLVLLACLGLVNASVTEDISKDSYFYGQSPPVYPSRKSQCFQRSTEDAN